ncbi:hypothetical protein FY557_08250 [Chryseobacterium sp. SN22]|uniref:hypothetical protein n=1 Tax=Chryseobacterium sp. SN22 TaxID=2606431 RepID=UPI0011EC6EEB|nr:hypothetical protein [Chryseobacterium sp. SN22]KAA0128562.1 hypothetical protein FY557_08250 [Chryseobacterium sp. SN22]
MKKIFTLLFAVASLAAYSQISIPANSSKGTIVTQDNTTIEYRDLKYEKGKVTYKNAQTGIEEFLYDNSVKSILEKTNPENPVSAENTSVSPALTERKEEKLTSLSEIRGYLRQNNRSYKSGRTVSDIGSGLIIGGGAAFLIGGLSNVSKAEKSTLSSGAAKKGSSTPLICGIIAMAGGVVMKIAGGAQMRNAVKEYQNADAGKFTPVYYVVNDGNGVGMLMKF